LIENKTLNKGDRAVKVYERHPNGAKYKPKPRKATKADLERLFGRQA
jgi:hypothetical protein